MDELLHQTYKFAQPASDSDEIDFSSPLNLLGGAHGKKNRSQTQSPDHKSGRVRYTRRMRKKSSRSSQKVTHFRKGGPVNSCPRPQSSSLPESSPKMRKHRQHHNRSRRGPKNFVKRHQKKLVPLHLQNDGQPDPILKIQFNTGNSST